MLPTREDEASTDVRPPSVNQAIRIWLRGRWQWAGVVSHHTSPQGAGFVATRWQKGVKVFEGFLLMGNYRPVRQPDVQGDQFAWCYGEDDPAATVRREGHPAVVESAPGTRTLRSVLADHWYLPDDVRDRIASDLEDALRSRVAEAEQTTDRVASSAAVGDKRPLLLASLRSQLAVFLGRALVALLLLQGAAACGTSPAAAEEGDGAWHSTADAGPRPDGPVLIPRCPDPVIPNTLPDWQVGAWCNDAGTIASCRGDAGWPCQFEGFRCMDVPPGQLPVCWEVIATCRASCDGVTR